MVITLRLDLLWLPILIVLGYSLFTYAGTTATGKFFLTVLVIQLIFHCPGDCVFRVIFRWFSTEGFWNSPDTSRKSDDLLQPKYTDLAIAFTIGVILVLLRYAFEYTIALPLGDYISLGAEGTVFLNFAQSLCFFLISPYFLFQTQQRMTSKSK